MVAADPELHITSLVVHATAKRAPGIAAALDALPGAQVHAVTEGGKLVVTLETDTADEMLGQIGRIQRLPGVLSATVVYQAIDSLEAMNQLIEPNNEREGVPDGHRPS
ncbi:chaperone NapD [Piscinibacter gummiphilus]|uniref:Chaperone NapD n=1 Tax=Piscinibacter gummiphilus TaxID=946333 RepID=A0ABZ0CU35_9BURK|nr:chaperone NapD [Piscinibacter gummiphilus]WOB08393.1 chaperone NapD [Piscinibacter gummiphilus]